MIDPEDQDFIDSELPEENTCPECNEWKNARREFCDSCIYQNN